VGDPGSKAPHTGAHYSEALRLGISGGITFGYFTFAYKGWLPHVALLTRNTFDPFDTILEWLAPSREVRQTAGAATAERHLCEALEAGYASARDAGVHLPKVVGGRTWDRAYLLREGAPLRPIFPDTPGCSGAETPGRPTIKPAGLS
jgi:Butirosin biosynthesis protein H, N-terminal